MRKPALAQAFGSRVRHESYSLVDGGQVLERSAVLITRGALPVEAVMLRLKDDPKVLGFSIDTRND